MINPGAVEIPGDEIDQNCDNLELCYVDVDSDGYGTNTDDDGDGVSNTIPSTDIACDGNLEATNDLDCDDGDASIYPGATEVVADGIDQNCDGVDVSQVADADNDGYDTTVVGLQGHHTTI